MNLKKKKQNINFEHKCILEKDENIKKEKHVNFVREINKL